MRRRLDKNHRQLRVSYEERKRTLSPGYALELFEAGQVEQAAKLGLARAQGVLADRHFYGAHGVRQDMRRSLDFARLAAVGGDKLGQFRLAHAYRQ